MKKLRCFAIEAEPEVIEQVRKYLQSHAGVSVQDVTAEVMIARKNERVYEWRKSLDKITDEFKTA